MKVVAKPIEVVAWFDFSGVPHPTRFRVVNKDESYTTVSIDKIITTEKEKLAGNHMMVYTCQSCINGVQRTLVIKYELSTMKWMLFKI